MTDQGNAQGQGQEAPCRVRVAARLSHPLVIAGEEARVYLRVDVETAAGRASRPPLAVGVALDRSGSMYGSKMAFAKLAVKHLVELLTAEERYRATRRLTNQLSRRSADDITRDSQVMKETRFHQYRYRRERDPRDGGRSR